MMQRVRLVPLTLLMSSIVALCVMWRYAPPLRTRDNGDAGRDAKSGVNSTTLLVNASDVSNATTALRVDLARRAPFLAKVYAATLFQLVIAGTVGGLVASSAPSDAHELPMDIYEGGGKGDRLRQRTFAALCSEPGLCCLVVLSFVALTELMIYRKDPSCSLRLLAYFAALEGCWLGLACAFVPIAIIAGALALTSLIFLMQTAVALGFAASGVDLGPIGPFLAEALTLLLTVALTRLAVEDHRTACSATAGVALFSTYILFDTQQIAARYNEDEYVAGALDLFLDILNLFFDLLRWLGQK